MRTAALAALALAFAPMAAAHIPGRPHGNTVKATLSYQEAAWRHSRYVCVRGTGEVKRWHCAASQWLRRELAQTRAKLVPADPIAAIRAVFGRYADQAISVARCETGGTFSVNATNGQYLGLFQMGDYARSRYGHSGTAYGQARAAYAYFRDSGYSWGPWECKP